jgi:hypothetical protein
LRTIGATPFAPFFTESATPFDAEADFTLALAFAREPLEPFDFGLEDRDPRELELDRRALDLDFVWATMTFLSPQQHEAAASRRWPATRCWTR